MELKMLLDIFTNSLEVKGASPHTIKAYKLDLMDYLKHLKETIQDLRKSVATLEE
jgi:site-specific recombinase XerD